MNFIFFIMSDFKPSLAQYALESSVWFHPDEVDFTITSLHYRCRLLDLKSVTKVILFKLICNMKGVKCIRFSEVENLFQSAECRDRSDLLLNVYRILKLRNEVFSGMLMKDM